MTTAPAAPDPSPYDAVLLVSFGGPEKAEDVVPFLENVTRGRNIGRERLEEVGEHYFGFGGRSPINDQNRAFLDLLHADLREAGLDLPVYWGNRNWDPYLADVLARMTADGVTRAACFVTAAYSSYSGCRQYRENLAAARDAVSAEVGTPPKLDRFRVYFDHPGFLGPNVDAVLGALAELPEAVRDGAHLAFVTHSIPTAMDDASGPGDQGGGAYVAQHRSVLDAVVAEVAEQTGRTHPAELVYCSRSGPPDMPWLEPDVNDHLAALHEAGAPGVVIAPIGFVSDHMEVVYDLDTEALATARELGLPAVRAATAGTDARFVGCVRDLLLERAAVERGEDVVRASTGGLGPAWDRCAVDCCANPRGVLPVAGGIEEA